MGNSEQAVKPTVKVGDTVRLKRSVRPGAVPEGRFDFRIAVVKACLSVPGGLFMDRDLRGTPYWNIDDVMVVAPIDECTAMIGKSVMKKSRKPFLSRQTINTVKGLTKNSVTRLPSYTFVEDSSDVECFRCVEVK